MKKIIFLFILNFFIYTVGYSQSIKGVIKDNTSNTPIKNTVVMLVKSKDSVLYKFARTDANGVFQIKKVDSGTYLLITTHPIFADYTDSLAINTDIDLGTLGITPKAKLLQEVIVKSGSPIKIKGDTTVYTADSFKVKDGANVEDLLRKLPGIQVGKNGEIKAMGETVKNVLVDGEEFFGNDPGMVVKNLQANAVQEVQVYDKKSDQAAFTGIDDGVSEKTINLKLKANRKSGYFGKIEAGGGTPDNYTNSVMLNAFQGKRKISAFGYMSNTGKTELGWDEADKFGGGEREGMTSGIDELSGGMWMSWSDGDSYSGGANGIPKNWNGGLHYSNKYKGDSLNINGSYRYGKINAPGGSSTFSKIYYPDSSWNNNSSNQMFSSKEKHTVSFTIENKIDSNNTIKFVNRGTYNQGISNNTYYEENITTQGDFINNSTRKVNGNTTSKGYNGVLTWNHKFKKARRTLSLSAIGDFKESNGISNQLSYNNYYKGGISNTKDTVDQQNKSINASTTITTSVAFTEPINKYLSLGINLSVNVANTGNDRNVFTPDGSGKYTVKYDSLSNEFDFKTSTYKPGFVLRLVKKKITAMLGTSVGYNRFEQVNNTKNITQHYNFINFFPTAGIRFTLKGNKRININYRGSAAAPSLQQLQPVPDNSNPLSIYTGNPNLKQSFTHNFSGGFNWSKPLSDNSIWSYFNYSTTNNAFTEYTTRDTIGRLFYKTINTNGNYYINLNLDYNFSVGKGKNKVGLGINPYIQLNKTNEFVDSILNTNYSNTYSVRLNVNKYKEDKFEFYFGPSISYTQSKSNINNTSNTNLWSMSGWADMTIYIKKKTQISANGNFNFRQKDPRYTKNNNYTTLNASVKQYLYKKEVSVKLGVYDIFNQNRGYSSDFSSYKFTESYFNTLKRYWLLTLSWEFNHQKQKAAPASVTK